MAYLGRLFFRRPAHYVEPFLVWAVMDALAVLKHKLRWLEWALNAPFTCVEKRLMARA